MKTQKESVTKPGEDFAALHGALKALREQMTFLITLPAGERRQFHYGGNAPLNAAVASLAAAKANPGLVPPAFNLAQFEQDVTRAANVRSLLAEVKGLASDLNDTLLSAGSKAVKASQQVRVVVQAMAKSTPGVKAVAQSLKRPSTRVSVRETTATAPPPAETPSVAPPPSENKAA